MRQRLPTLAVVLFMLALTAVGLFTAQDYGMPIDEPAEQTILRENLNEYALTFWGEDRADLRLWDGQDAGRISQSAERDHGQSAYYLAAPLLTLSKTAPDRLMTLWHQYTWLWFMVGVLSLYGLMRGLGLGRTLACATALLLYLSPRFFAEGHYNNKDIVLLSLTLATLASGAWVMKRLTFPRALLFSLAGAMATNTKIVGVFAWGLCGLAMLWRLASTRSFHKRSVSIAVCAVVAYVAFYALLTPALWADPPGYLRYVLGNASSFSRWTGVVLFRGEIYNPTRGLPLPRSYLPVTVLLTLPVAYLLLAAIGQGKALWQCLRGDANTPMLCTLTLLWLVPCAYVVLARPLLYNGWRHFYFIYAGIAAMGGLGLQAIATALRRRRTLKTIAAVVLSGLFAFQAWGIASNHPYQFSYYNPLAGKVAEAYELDYWEVSAVNAMRMLNQTESKAGVFPILIGARDEMSRFGLENSYGRLSASERSTLAFTKDQNAPYLYANATYATLYQAPAPEGYETLFTLESYGNSICTVYRRLDSAP